MDDGTTRRRRLYIFIAITVSSIAMIVLLAWPEPRLPTLPIYQTADNYPILDSSSVTSDDNILFFNGRNFVSFNPQTGESSTLLENNQLYPRILFTYISPDHHYVLLRAAETGTDDILAIAAGDRVDFEYETDLVTNGLFFLLDTTTGEHRYIEYGYDEIQWKDDSSGFYHKLIEQPGIYLYSLGNGTSTLVIEDEAYGLIAQKGDDLLLSKSTGESGWDLIKHNLARGSEEVLAENLLSPVKLSPDGRYAVGVFKTTKTVDEEFPRGTLRVLDLQTGEPIYSRKDVGSFNAVWSQDSGSFYLRFDGYKILLFKIADRQLYQLVADQESGFVGDESGYYLIPLLDGFLYYSGSDFGKYFSFSAESTIVNPLQGLDELRSAPYYADRYSIVFLKSSNKFAVASYFDDLNRDQTYRLAADYTRSIGVDINFLDISY